LDVLRNYIDLMTNDEARKFLLPSPTEVFILVATGFTGLCFVLMVGGDRFVNRVRRLSRTAYDLIGGGDGLSGNLPIIMVAGILGIAAAFFVFSRWEKLFVALMLIAFSFADSTWSLLHYIAFAIKYTIVIYLAAYGAFFVYRNWNRINQPVHWWVIAYVGWLAFSAVYHGNRVNDIWYFGTQFTLIVAFGIGWMSRVDDIDKLMEFNILLAYTAVIITGFHMMSPVVAPKIFDGGRYISQFTNATGFATTYVLFVISLVWLALAHPSEVIRKAAIPVALIGLGMILLSGTRNATAALACAIVVLSITFRSKLIFWAIGIGGFGAIVLMLILGDNETVNDLGSRLGSTRNTRLELWVVYARSVVENPIIGWGADGQTGAYYGAWAQEIADNYSSRGFAPGVHNAILGQAVRFGLVGMGIFLGLFTYAFWRAQKIVLDRGVPQEFKKAYALPVAILVTLFLEGAFEDNFATPRGSVVNVLYGTMIILVVMFADKIEARIASGDLTAEMKKEIAPPEPPKKLVRI